jgi:hypothetical protein
LKAYVTGWEPGDFVVTTAEIRMFTRTDRRQAGTTLKLGHLYRIQDDVEMWQAWDDKNSLWAISSRTVQKKEQT